MELATVGEVIAERRLVLVRSDGSKREILVMLGKPQRFPGSDCYCPYQIVGFSTQNVRYGAGVDGFQALQLALRQIATELALRNNSEEGQLFWHNDLDLGFPLHEGTDDQHNGS